MPMEVRYCPRADARLTSRAFNLFGRDNLIGGTGGTFINNALSSEHLMVQFPPIAIDKPCAWGIISRSAGLLRFGPDLWV